MNKDRIVLCMKWGSLYPAGYVNRLHRAVRNAVQGEFRFICMTDDTLDLDPDIEVRPIPNLNLPEEGWKHGAWPKISVLKAGEFLPGEGRVLFLDLDNFIIGSLDCFFEPDDPFVAIAENPNGKKFSSRIARRIRNAMRRFRNKPKMHTRGTRYTETGQVIPRNTMNTGVFSFNAGTLGHICDALMKDPQTAIKNYDNEQHFVECHLEKWVGWPEGWLHSYKLHLRRPFWLSWVLQPCAPDPNVPIVAFRGDPRPIELATGRHQGQGELPHCWRGPVKWAKAYWDKYGD